VSQALADRAKIQVAATANFAVGDWVLISEGAGASLVQEIGRIKASGVVTDDYIELSEALKHDYTTSAWVMPVYIDAEQTAWASGTGAYDIYACPDRNINP